MDDVRKKAANQLTEITECPICMSDFIDPRMLPCIHTFCFECLKRTGEEAQMKPGDKMPCPLCRKEFIIPFKGIIGVQKNFFMENLLAINTALQIESSAIIFCDSCNFKNGGKTAVMPKASLRCLECQNNYCDSCIKVHQLQKLSRNHQMVKIGSDDKTAMKPHVSVKCCTKHTNKPLDYYCSDCKKIVCVSCFVESHKSHDCKDVTAIDEEFRKTIKKKARIISCCTDELVSMRENTEKRKANFLQVIVQNENAIIQRNKQLKNLIDRDTKSIIDELSVIKSNHLKQIESEKEEIERSCTIMKSFEAYCTELRLKGSAIDICSSVDQLLARADDLQRDHEAKIIGRPCKSVEVTFQAADLLEDSQKSNKNFVGDIHVIVFALTENNPRLENYAIVVGLNDGTTTTRDVIKINLHQQNAISTIEQIPNTMQKETFAAVYCNTMYVIGVGDNADEIWKYSSVDGWMKCASLVKGRRSHSATFIDEVLYICGGFVDSSESVLDGVEAYNAITDKCAVVGKLYYSVASSGNCAPFKGLLYIFGGVNESGFFLNYVQVYDTKTNTCSLFSGPLPSLYGLKRAVLWETSVILFGSNNCVIFNCETKTCQKRERFRTGVGHFGLLLENERVFVIGGGDYEKDKDGKTRWKCRDDVRYVPLQNIIDDKPIEWKIHAKSPKPTLVHAYANMRVLN